MEVELQFVYHGGRPLVVPTSLADLELRRSSVRTLLDTYFDTETLDLRQAGCSLRVRQADDWLRPRLTFKGPSRKRAGAKHRHESEVKIESLPASNDEIVNVLRDNSLETVVRKLAAFEFGAELRPIGQLRNRRSEHRYAHGLHRLELTWDELEFPTGEPQIRLEIEARSDSAERLLQKAEAEVMDLFGEDLSPPELGKMRELCERLYPELLAA
jgi:inorganic triphosphatase YgiF